MFESFNLFIPIRIQGNPECAGSQILAPKEKGLSHFLSKLLVGRFLSLLLESFLLVGMFLEHREVATTKCV